jgi:hypothetical protein
MEAFMFVLFMLLFAVQAPTATPAKPQPQPQPRRAAAPATATLQVRVTDRSGTPLEGAAVTVEGPSARNGDAGADGLVGFRTMTAGTYRIRAAHDAFITLEKELAIRNGTASTLDFALAAAPENAAAPAAPPPSAPPAPAAAPAPAITPGEPRIIDVPDLAERSLSGREPVRAVPIGCSGLSNAQLLVVRESIQRTTRDDADQMIYVVAGEATLAVAGREQQVSGGWFTVVPRGTPHAVTRRGRNPAILLSIVGGPPCGK